MKVSLLLIKNSIGSWRRWRNHSLPMNKSPIPHLFHHFSLHTCTQATSWRDGVPGLFISSLQISWFSYMLVFSASSLHLIVHATCRMWEFSVGLYMISIWPESLLLAAVYGVVESSSTALLGPIIGEWVDKLTYLKVLTLALNFSYHLTTTFFIESSLLLSISANISPQCFSLRNWMISNGRHNQLL